MSRMQKAEFVVKSCGERESARSSAAVNKADAGGGFLSGPLHLWEDKVEMRERCRLTEGHKGLIHDYSGRKV